ncbi:helix-turn-helix transcriptional regulator [Rothia amarae]|uniref:helix-turn-helix transcriptional regulator n=1 Tax=Rothia amarae TaxID=169480 RepID=UPI00338B3C2C
MIVALDPRTRLSEQEAADYLGVSIHQLRKWRVQGTGPKFTKPNYRTIHYRVSWLEDYLAQETREPII